MTNIIILLVKLDYSFILSIEDSSKSLFLKITNAKFVKKDVGAIVPNKSIIVTNQLKTFKFFKYQKCLYKKLTFFNKDDTMDKLIKIVIPNLDCGLYKVDKEKDLIMLHQAIRNFSNGDMSEKYYDVCLSLANLAEYYPKGVVSWLGKL